MFRIIELQLKAVAALFQRLPLKYKAALIITVILIIILIVKKNKK